MDFEAKRITFNIITKMIFGEDVTEKFGKIEMEDTKTGQLNSLDLFEAFNQLMQDCVA